MEVLTVVQAAEFLQVHQETPYRLLDKEAIPAAKAENLTLSY